MNKMHKRHQQQGAALIFVLIVIVFIAAVGTISVRSSLLALKLASNSQVHARLLLSSDAALLALENAKQLVAESGMQGIVAYFNSEEHAQDQLVFCYQTQAVTALDLQHAAVIGADGAIRSQASQGFCRATPAVGGRAVVLTQLYLKKNNTAQPISSFTSSENSLDQTAFESEKQQFAVTAISVLPNNHEHRTEDITSCFQQAEHQVMACFSQLNVPFNLQRSHLNTEPDSESTSTTKTGIGSIADGFNNENNGVIL